MNRNSTEGTGIVGYQSFILRRTLYCKRLTSYYQSSYQRMLKYYERGFYTFTDLNINNEDFINDIEALTPIEFVDNHVNQFDLQVSFSSMLTTDQRTKIFNSYN